MLLHPQCHGSSGLCVPQMPRGLPTLNLSKIENMKDEPEHDDPSVADQQSPRIKSTLKLGGAQKSARSLTAYTQVHSRAFRSPAGRTSVTLRATAADLLHRHVGPHHSDMLSMFCTG